MKRRLPRIAGAVETLQLIRHDLALRYGNPNAHSSFRDGRSGNVFFSSLTCYYSALDSAKNAADLDRMLLEARDSAELLKSAELEDYFQDECVNLLKSKITKVPYRAAFHFAAISCGTRNCLSD